MKKKIAISSIFVAIFFLLVAGTIPHHHHENGVICFHVKKHHITHHDVSEHEDCDDDVHNNHDANSCQHNPNCISETSYYSNPAGKIKIKAPSFDNGVNPDHFHFFPLFYLAYDLLISPAYNTDTKPRQGEYLLFYTSATVSRFHGLRAPPFFRF